MVSMPLNYVGFGDEYGGQRGDRMDYIMLAWDCDSIVVLNPEAVIPI